MPKTAKFRKTFKKRIIKPGTYHIPVYDKDGKIKRDAEGNIVTREETITTDRINRWYENHKSMIDAGLSIPAPFRHDPKAVPVRLNADQDDIDAFKNGGFWRKLWKDKSGALWGEMEVRNKDAAEKIGTSVEDVSLVAKGVWQDGNGRKWEDALTHIALVTHPVAKDTEEGGFEEVEPNLEVAASFSFQDTLALSMAGDIQFGMDSEELNSGMGEINASALTVKDILKMLSSLDPPIRLPDDTTSDNFLERLGTALAAIEAIGAAGDEGTESVREPNPKSKEQPGPVAMSKELEFSLGLLASANVVNPATRKPYTQAEIKALADKQSAPVVNLQMSAEDQAAVNLARKTLSGNYQKRVETLVKQGQVTPAYAKKELVPFLSDIQFSFDESGNQIDTPFDKLLKACEAIPPGSVLTGRTPAAVKAQRGSVFNDQAFSLSGQLEEHELDMEGPDVIPMSDADADALVDAQLKMSGYGASRVEGGFAAAK